MTTVQEGNTLPENGIRLAVAGEPNTQGLPVPPVVGEEGEENNQDGILPKNGISVPIPSDLSVLGPADDLAQHKLILPSSVLIRAIDLESDTYTKRAFQGKVLLGFMLRVKVGERQNAFNRSFGQPTNLSGSKMMKTTQTFGGRSYDRLLTFADIKNPGQCFAVLTKNVNLSKQFFTNNPGGRVGVGNVFVFNEPKHTNSRLGSSNTIVVENYLPGVYPLHSSSAKYVPSVPLRFPPPGETEYFCLHNCTTLDIILVGIFPSCCAGELCDRQQNPDDVDGKTFRCGCIHVDNRSNGTVFKMIVSIPCSTGVHRDGTIDSTDFLSFKTSLLFVSKDTLKNFPYSLKDDLGVNNIKIVSAHVDKVCAYVNNHGGWTIIGWTRTGLVHDESNPKDNEQIGSDSVSPHVVYLQPTDTNLSRGEQYSELCHLPLSALEAS
jgi:hypothetical protein